MRVRVIRMLVSLCTHFLILCCVHSRESYNHVSSWLNDARALANPDIAIVLVGNKIDLTAGALGSLSSFHHFKCACVFIRSVRIGLRLFFSMVVNVFCVQSVKLPS